MLPKDAGVSVAHEQSVSGLDAAARYTFRISPWNEAGNGDWITTEALAECTAGLTGSVTDADEAARSAVLSGTGKAGETITVATPNGPVTAVVAADGSWTTTVTGLVDGDNTLTVTSSDNCASVVLSVIIDVLEIPVVPPIAAAAAAALGLGVFGFGGLRRRAVRS